LEAPLQPTADEIEQLIDVYEVAKRLDVGIGIVREMAKDGRFPAPILVGNRKQRWRSAAVNDWIKRGERG